MENDSIKKNDLSRDMNCHIYGITPGKYRLKVVWNKVAPFTKPYQVLCYPHPGDYESTNSPLVSIEKGMVTEEVRIECKSLVKS